MQPAGKASNSPSEAAPNHRLMAGPAFSIAEGERIAGWFMGAIMRVRAFLQSLLSSASRACGAPGATGWLAWRAEGLCCGCSIVTFGNPNEFVASCDVSGQKKRHE